MDPLVYRYGEFLTCLAVLCFFACTLYDDHKTRKVLRTMALNLDALTASIDALDADIQKAVAALSAPAQPDQQPQVDALAGRVLAAASLLSSATGPKA